MVLALVGIVVSFTCERLARRYLLFTSAFYLVFICASTIAENMPVRNLTSVFWLLVPFSAYAVAWIVGQFRFSTSITYAVMVLWIVIGTVQSFGYTFQAQDEVVRTAAWSRRIIRSESFQDRPSKIVVEVRRGGAAERDVV